MVRNYESKNPYLKNSRLSIEQTHQLILMYLKGVKVSQSAEFLGVSRVSLTKIYARLDEVISYEGIFQNFTRFLVDQNNEGLQYLLYTIRGIITRARRGKANDDDWEDWEDWEIEELKLCTPHIAYLWGFGDIYPLKDSIEGCIYHCDSNTPPLIVKRKIETGCVQEIREKRMACRTCPMRFKEIYIPGGNRTQYFCTEKDGKSFVYEPNNEYLNDWRELMLMWIDILWFLGHYRSLDRSLLFKRIIHGSYFSALKCGEIKVSHVVNGAGSTVPTPLLYPEQMIELERGFSYVSTLDWGAVKSFLEELK